MNKPAPKHFAPQPPIVPQRALAVVPPTDLADQIQALVDEVTKLGMENAELKRANNHQEGQLTELRLANSQLALESKTDREAVIQAAACVEAACLALEPAKLAMPATGVLDNVKTDIGNLTRLAHGIEDGPLTREETK